METTTVSTTTSPTSTSSSTTTVTLVKRHSLVPPKWEDGVRVVGMSECREAALSLAHAFAADDYAQYLADPGDMDACSAEDKWKLHLDITLYTVAATCLSGRVTTVGPDYDSVALCVPPGRDLDGWWTTLRSGLWRMYFQLSAEGRKRYYDEILPLLRDTKADVLGDREANALYLVMLGTKPNSQGRGYAKRLLVDILHRADVENRPVYLESSSVSNNAYYGKFGFEIKKVISLDRGRAPVRLSIMVREPQPARKVAYPSAASTTAAMMVRKFHMGSKMG
ncbi:hypothetical protein B0H63DRAFT_389941 [Podospora didyma]|uniref:N-acetyltransferase domain-containing protein n=1 Tax=Podospora didyma TaxID=330526 RepID=A0AAE0NZC1_9PEZI|nr:hypothetical protein B0H63DRAFT_389941 [Podospora didyma]